MTGPTFCEASSVHLLEDGFENVEPVFDTEIDVVERALYMTPLSID